MKSAKVKSAIQSGKPCIKTLLSREERETEVVLTGVGDASPPAQAVQTDGGALGEAVGLERHPPESFHRLRGDSSSGLGGGEVGLDPD